MSGRIADALTQLIIETFRLNGRLLTAGDALVVDLGLSSARWQVLGAVALAAAPLPVAQIARNMGLTRQAVQRVVNDLGRMGLVRHAPNPHHRRAKLVLLTAPGRAAYAAALERQRPWADALGHGLGVKQLENAAAILKSVRERLDDQSSSPQGCS
jgi:DNA-binding MarR family transcriptional regulator